MKKFSFAKIKEYREAKGQTRKELADKIGISQQQLWNWENGEDGKALTTTTLAKIADALNKKTDNFFVEQDKN